MSARAPQVSVLTPVHRPVPEYLAELHACLDEQRDDVDWEWAIQVDGGRSLLRRIPATVRADARVSLDANGRWLGQATTRNVALARVRHRLTQTVDADDLLLPGALRAGAQALEDEPDLAFAFGRTLELREDGTYAPGKNVYAPGRIEPGVLARDWQRRGGSCSIVVASVMWRTTVLEAYGGWPASAAGTDVMLLLAVADRHPGRCLDDDAYVYRSHPGQVHRTWLRHSMRPPYRALTRRMLAARRELEGAAGADAAATAARAGER
jgi:glycosyltransferase involved in cell wall biosynthesis